MTKKKISVDQFVKNQVKKWETQFSGKKAKAEAQIPVITVAMEPGSGGSLIAQKIAEQLEFDLFHRDIVQQIAKTAKIRSTVVNSLEKERLSGVKDFISSLMEDQYIHPDTYLKHLLVVISTIAKHGRAVIVGRGANFILPAEDIFAVRVIAPLEKRIREVALTYRVTTEEAKRRVIQRESKRKAFVGHSFHADISDPIHYDLTINTGKMSIESAVEAVIGAVMAKLGENS
ncbi:MAG: cytidylate kinase-like family protein [Desulfobacterales bacterium]